MSCFEEALRCCCQEEGKEFSHPDMSRYSTPIQWTNYPLDLTGNIDFDYKEHEHGVYVAQCSTPLLKMEDMASNYTTRYFVEPSGSSQQDADLGKQKSPKTEERDAERTSAGANDNYKLKS